MKARRHVALLVEDDAAMAAEMIDLLDSLGYGCVHVPTQEDAEHAVEEGKFCFVLLDLEIKLRADSIKPRVEGGFSVLQAVRERFPRVNERGEHAVQVIVVSGHGKDHRHIREAMRLKADDFICKPIFDANPGIGDTIKNALEKSGRSDHARCEAITRAAESEIAPGAGGIAIAIAGREERQRVEIEIGGRSVLVTPATFLVLLQLVKARVQGGEGWVHKNDLGAKTEQGWRTMSRFKDELSPYLPPKQTITNNDRNGRYRLSSAVEITQIDHEKLASNSEERVRTLAAEIRKLRAP